MEKREGTKCEIRVIKVRQKTALIWKKNSHSGSFIELRTKHYHESWKAGKHERNNLSQPPTPPRQVGASSRQEAAESPAFLAADRHRRTQFFHHPLASLARGTEKAAVWNQPVNTLQRLR
jgi:hypothetical protein